MLKHFDGIQVGLTATPCTADEADHDGYKLDANHDTPIQQDDLPGLTEAYRTRDERWLDWLAFSSPRPAGEGPGVRAE
ncbi:MAG: hypothetical protein L0Y39_12915 [Methylococcaceae bacterium]|nr:hypothetical protein [Methylococcaceae bacterium]